MEMSSVIEDLSDVPLTILCYPKDHLFRIIKFQSETIPDLEMYFIGKIVEKSSPELLYLANGLWLSSKEFTQFFDIFHKLPRPKYLDRFTQAVCDNTDWSWSPKTKLLASGLFAKVYQPESEPLTVDEQNQFLFKKFIDVRFYEKGRSTSNGLCFAPHLWLALPSLLWDFVEASK